jgi:predicted metal-dependent phosphoesterase TrpH
MHTHCEYSFDSGTTIEAQARAIRRANINVVCATDHDTIEGALRLRELADGFRVVVGEEVATRDGELIGLFLEHAVPTGLSAEDTISHIHEQGGVVSVPHPFSHTRPHRIRRDALERLWPLVDCIEVLDAREASTDGARQAQAFARERNIPGAVGSDAHRESEVGRAWIEIDDFSDADDFVAALRGGVARRRVPGAMSRAIALYEPMRKWLTRRRT